MVSSWLCRTQMERVEPDTREYDTARSAQPYSTIWRIVHQNERQMPVGLPANGENRDNATLKYTMPRGNAPLPMKDQTMSKSTPDLRIADAVMDLEPGTDKVPLAPVVYGLTAHLNDAALTKSVQAVLGLGKSKLPMEVDLEGAKFVPGGAEVTVNAGSGRFLRAKATAVIGISAHDDEMVEVEVREIKALGKLPIESIVGPVLDKALDKAAAFPGVEKNVSRSRSLRIDPNVLLKSQGVPLRFAKPGSWTVTSGADILTAVFSAK